MTDDTILPFAFPAVGRKKVTAAFDGGRITSDGGVMLLAGAARRGDARHRRHLRPGARPSATVAVQRPLRRTLLDAERPLRAPADPRLRYGHGPAGGGDPASRQAPSGREVRGHLRRLVRHIRRRWPQTRLTIRGDGHYGRPEVMDWCEASGVEYLFGLPGNTVLDRLVDEAADDIRTRRALEKKPCQRGFAETRYRAKSWKTARRACARIEATTRGLDIRFVVTSLEAGSAEHVYEVLYCARGLRRSAS